MADIAIDIRLHLLVVQEGLFGRQIAAAPMMGGRIVVDPQSGSGQRRPAQHRHFFLQNVRIGLIRNASIQGLHPVKVVKHGEPVDRDHDRIAVLMHVKVVAVPLVKIPGMAIT